MSETSYVDWRRSSNNDNVLSLVFCSVVLISAFAIMGLFSRKNHFPVEGRTVVITGGSQGLGLSAAKQLAAKGANVVIVAQDVTKLKAAVQDVASSARSPSSQRFHYISRDLRDPSSAPQILSEVTKWNGDHPPDVVWCCAGRSLPGFFASSSIDTLRGQMDTNYWSTAYIAHAVLNLWTQVQTPAQKQQQHQHRIKASSPAISDPERPRHLVFTCSTVAFVPIAGYAPYTPAKAAMRVLADTLQQEVAVYNGSRANKSSFAPAEEIKIHTLFPMGILTPGFFHENTLKPALTVELEKADKPQTADEVAQIAIARLEAGEKMITSMFLGHVLKGVGMGASLRNGLSDLFWIFIGSVAIVFAAPDLLRKCKRWGMEKGMAGAK